MSQHAPDGWTIIENRFDPATAKAYEGLFTLGSGYLHVRGSLEEHLAGQPQNVEYERRPANVTAEKFRKVLAQWGTYVPGVFGRHPVLNNQMVNLPWPLGLAPIVDGERLGMLASRVRECRRELSLREGVLRRRLVWETRSGVVVTVALERFVSLVRPHLIVQKLEVRADRACHVRVEAGIDADVRTNGHEHFVKIDADAQGDGSLSCEVTTDAGESVGMRSRAWMETLHRGVGDVRTEGASNRTSCLCTLTGFLDPDRPWVVHKRTWVHTSRDPQVGETTEHEHACGVAYDDLFAEHAAEWSRRWDLCDVRIDGDGASQLAVRTAVFHLIRAHVPDDSRVAIDAKGFAGEAYWGRFFWDAEMCLLPFYLYTQPERARTLIDFRVRTLEGARRNARRYGYEGARYAWESDHLGDECCPNWQYADHEVHVTAAVAYGLLHYAAAVDDAPYLDGAAASVLVETARYWMQRITFDDRSRCAGPRLLGVMGPDEYKPITHDNAYTNAMVARALRLAAEHGGHAGATERERQEWETTAAGLPVLRDARGLVLQCEGFHHLADPEFERLWADRSRPFAAHVSQERLYRSKALKQADVLMLMTLLPQDFTDEEVRRAWDYYVPYTTHDSSLSPGAHCLAACRLGLDDAAWEFWLRGSRLDMPVADGGHGGAAEGIHIAGAAAVWQMAVMGFGGMRSALQCPDRLTISPRLPKAWRSLRFSQAWRGRRVHVEIGPNRAIVRNDSDRSVPVEIRGQQRIIQAHGMEEFA